MPRNVALEQRAIAILNGDESPDVAELYSLAIQSRDLNKFELARRLFAKVRGLLSQPGASRVSHGVAPLKVIQQLALCTYRSPDRPARERLDEADQIIREALEMSRDPETLGIAGAVSKARWAVDRDERHLVQSLAYYTEGYEQGVAKDDGYTGINAAFVHDLLASLAGTGETKKRHLRAAAEIRQEVIRVLEARAGQVHSDSKDPWSYYTTLVEAYLGLDDYERAREWLERASGAVAGCSGWAREATLEQLAGLTALRGHPRAWDVLEQGLKVDPKAAQAWGRGKFGVALSGGGFRASLYHIGVLARLAELDQLRNIEVMSCVSGGSIIGAYYYLEVRHLLQTLPDDKIEPHHFAEIVERIAERFLKAVQSNIRNRAYTGIWTNVLSLCPFPVWPNDARTQRLARLLESELFSRVPDEDNRRNPRTRDLPGLKINPRDGDPDFDPRIHNWRRRAKVPVLVLNATTLNTGHNWQFTTSFMGESPWVVDAEVGGTDRYRRMYYDEAPERYRSFPLGQAVAASTCVPLLFNPLALPGMYPDRTVRLVDGGIHDNQGIVGLLEQGCTVLLISDASGQMNAEPYRSLGRVPVPFRSNDVLMARVRAAQYQDIRLRCRSRLLRQVHFIHLRKGVDNEEVCWVGCEDLRKDVQAARHGNSVTDYGVPKEAQRLLAAVRTDLDAFSTSEAYALMADGYLMARHEYNAPVGGAGDETFVPWKFREILPALQTPGTEAHKLLLKRLRVGRSLFFKGWKLAGPFGKLVYVAVAAPAVLVALALLCVLAGVCLGVFGAGAEWIRRPPEGLSFWDLPRGELLAFAALYFLLMLVILAITILGLVVLAVLLLGTVVRVLLKIQDLWYLREGRV